MDTGAVRRAGGKRRGRSGDKREWIALGAIAVVAAGAIGGVLMKFVFSGQSGPTHTVSTPNSAAGFTREPGLEKQMKVDQLRDSVIQSSGGKAELAVFMQNALEAVSTAGFCLFSAQTFVPAVFFRLGPNHWLTRLAGKLIPRSGPAVRLLLAAKSFLRFNALSLLPHAEAIRLATGLPMYTGGFILLGERGYNLERLFNLREGLSAKDDALPERLTKTPQKPGKPDTVVPLEKMLPLYYKIRGWDKEGKPSRKKLESLGIELHDTGLADV